MEASEGRSPDVPASGDQETGPDDPASDVQEGDDTTAAPSAPPAPWTADQRRTALAENLQQAVRQGWRVESQTEFQANLVMGHRTNHLLHLILSIVTLGLWLIVWLIVALTNKEKRRVVTIDEYGRITG